MTALIERPMIRPISRNIGEIVVAYLVAAIIHGGVLEGAAGLVAVAQILLAIKLNVFALPLVTTPVFGTIPLWGWYVVVTMWLFRFVQLTGYTPADIRAQLERAYYAMSESPAPDSEVVADGGSDEHERTAANTDAHPDCETMEERL